MSTLKDYARQAKDRMKNGFWQQAKTELQQEKEVAATLGLNERKLTEEHRRKLQRKIYDYDGFCEEEEFYAKVVEILSGDAVVSNPIMRLADKDYMQTLSPQERQTYISKVAARYRNAVEKYNGLRN